MKVSLDGDIPLESDEPISTPLTAGVDHLNGKDPVTPITLRCLVLLLELALPRREVGSSVARG